MDDYYTIKQAAIILKVHHLTIRRYINEGKLKAIKVGGNVRISQSDLKNFMSVFVPHSQPTKASTSLSPDSETQSFSSSDPLFRLKARGLSLDNIK